MTALTRFTGMFQDVNEFPSMVNAISGLVRATDSSPKFVFKY